jgi:hypothetical protein
MLRAYTPFGNCKGKFQCGENLAFLLYPMKEWISNVVYVAKRITPVEVALS